MKKYTHSIEPLEARIAPATFTVTSNADDGGGTLREALALAAVSMGTDTIAFNLAVMQTTIQLITGLDTNSPVILDGRTQPGYVDTPLVTVSGTFAFSQIGLAFGPGASGSQVHGLAISNFPSTGIHLNAGDVIIAGCTITGNQTGIYVGGNDVTIGTTGAVGRNVISGNTLQGIFGQVMNGLVVQNSHIGVDRTGTIVQGNGGAGIAVIGAGNLTIGGAEKNVIAGNGGDGIDLEGVYGDVRVQNNWVGIGANGAFGPASKNGGIGIHAYGSANFVIGTDGMLGAPNYIANNAGPGIIVDTVDNFGAGTAVITGNIIGSAPIMMGLVPASNGIDAIRTFGPGIRIGGAGAEANNIAWQTGDGINSLDGQAQVRGNFFADGGDEVIDVLGDGPTPNHVVDPGMPPMGNEPENFPVLTGAFPDSMGNFILIGSLNEDPNTTHRVDVYGYAPGANTYTYIGSDSFTVGNSATVDFTIAGLNLTGYTRVTATATETSSGGGTSEFSAAAIVGPGIYFIGGGFITEGNAGATLLSFTVALTAAPTGAVSVGLSPALTSTATLGADYTFSPSVLNFNPTTTQQTVTVAITGDTLVEPRELIDFVLGSVMGDAVIAVGSNPITIFNDDTSLRILPGGKVATWKDVDGDFVTLKATKGILHAGDFLLDAQGTLGGEVLQALTLSNDPAAAKGVGIALTAKFDKVNNLGDGSVHVGLLNAATVDLGVVTLPGDLAFILAGDANLADGAVKSLTVGSMGVLGNSQTQGTGIGGYFNGKVGALTVKGDFLSLLYSDTSMTPTPAAGGFGSIVIGGSFFSIVTPGESYGEIFTSGSITSLKIAGSMVVDAASFSPGTISALGKIGTVAIAGGMRGGGGIGREAIISAGTSLGTVTLGAMNDAILKAGTTLGKATIGEMNDAKIFATGNANPATAAAALAIAGVTVRGRVSQSEIGAGVTGSGGIANPDAQIGAILIGGDWDRSVAHAGTGPGADGFFGGTDDALLAPSAGFTNKTGIISKIASVTIKGHIYGTAGGTDSFGFVAQSIGKFVRGTTAYTLRANATPNALPLDLVSLSITGDVFLREVI